MEFDLARSYDGLEIQHEEIENEGYTIKPNGLRIGKSPRSIASKNSEGDLHRIMNIFEMKIEQFLDDFMVNFEQTMLLDGTQDPLAPPGLTAYMTLDPTAGTIGGKNRADPIFQHVVRAGSTVGAAGTIAADLESGIRQANLYNRGSRSMIDYALCGADWLDGYKAYRRANDSRFNNSMDRVNRLDIAIPDDALYHDNVALIHCPAFEEIQAKGLSVGGITDLSKTAFFLPSRTWSMCHTYDSLEEVSIPQDPPTQRFSRIFVENRVVLVPRKIRGNMLSTIA